MVTKLICQRIAGRVMWRTMRERPGAVDRGGVEQVLGDAADRAREDDHARTTRR